MANIKAEPSACARLLCAKSESLVRTRRIYVKGVEDDFDDIIPFAFDTPSPDDLVKAARNAHSNTNHKTKATKSVIKRREPYIRKNGTVA